MCDDDPMLDAQAVLREYGLKDVDTARKIIKEAGGRVIGGRWLARRSRILAWENAANCDPPVDQSANPINDQPRARRGKKVRPSNLEPGWWHDEQTS